MDLVDFINARLDEDEQTARAVVSSHEREPRLVPCVAAADWSHRYDSDDYGGTGVADGAGHVIVPMSYESGALQRIHIARHDPARVLAEVEAKRRIIALHPHTTKRQVYSEGHLRAVGGPDWETRLEDLDALYCGTCHHVNDGCIDDRTCETLHLLALPYAGHPSYRQEWRP
jgi:hypothetical protein